MKRKANKGDARGLFFMCFIHQGLEKNTVLVLGGLLAILSCLFASLLEHE